MAAIEEPTIMNPPDTQNKVAKKKRKPRKPSDNKLSPDQKRQNHVSSEQRRRQAMRETYDTLVELVPDLCDAEKRSEFMIYAKTTNYLKWLYLRNQQLRTQLLERLRSRDAAEGTAIPSMTTPAFSSGYELPRHLVWNEPE